MQIFMSFFSTIDLPTGDKYRLDFGSGLYLTFLSHPIPSKKLCTYFRDDCSAFSAPGRYDPSVAGGGGGGGGAGKNRDGGMD